MLELANQEWQTRGMWVWMELRGKKKQTNKQTTSMNEHIDFHAWVISGTKASDLLELVAKYKCTAREGPRA